MNSQAGSMWQTPCERVRVVTNLCSASKSRCSSDTAIDTLTSALFIHCTQSAHSIYTRKKINNLCQKFTALEWKNVIMRFSLILLKMRIYFAEICIWNLSHLQIGFVMATRRKFILMSMWWRQIAVWLNQKRFSKRVSRPELNPLRVSLTAISARAKEGHLKNRDDPKCWLSKRSQDEKCCLQQETSLSKEFQL